MYLTPELAQQIAERTTSVLGKNINIMDQNGIIIGSGHKDRLNTFHEGAVRVLQTKNPFTVTNADAQSLQGAKPGINLPIRFNGEIIGVVGITGDPQEVEPYGEIVKNLVELMLAHDFLRREVELETRLLESFFQQVIGGEIKDLRLLAERAKLFKLELDSLRSVIVIHVEPFDARQISYEIQDLTRHFQLDRRHTIFFIRGENLVCIRTVAPKGGAGAFEDAFPEQVLSRLEKVFHSVAMGVGQTVASLPQLEFSYEGAKYALKVGAKVRDSSTRIYRIDNLAFDYFVPYLGEKAAHYFLDNMFRGSMQKVFEDQSIGEVVEGLVRNDLNISQTAKSLFVHRNTLLYRMDKIRDATGLDPRNAMDLFTLLLGYHVYLYYK
ncbi:MAG: sugar diacid recognition domain-containing protein [Bacillota bacterium]|jgi:carbohydrate diacid regulator|nr:sugar diacid recognition domain-containing protein [Bacillota bacterium]